VWYGEPNATSSAIDYAKFRSRSHDAVIRVYDAAGNVIETQEHAGVFKQWWLFSNPRQFFKNRAKSVSVIRQPKFVFFRKLLNCRFFSSGQARRNSSS
jgi:hypothetical protein